MIKDIISGINEYSKAFSLISDLKLWKYFIIPMLISFIVASLIIVSSFTFSRDIGVYISGLWKWEFGKYLFGIVSTFISGLLIIALGLILYKHIVMALAAPFMSPVSEKIEFHLMGKSHQHRNTSFKEQLIRSLRVNLRNLVKEIMLTIPILLISFIPVIGLVSTIILFLLQAYYAGFGNMDYTLERHFKYKESVNFVQENRGIAIGNGIIFMLFLLIPIIGVILVLPLSVTAATSETIKRIKIKEISE